MSEKFVAIGDIHGCVLTVKKLLEDLLIEHKDRKFVFVGDYIDRGPDSKKTIEYLIEFSKTYACVFLRGNHEQMLLDFQNGEPLEQWQRNGGKTTYMNYLNEKKKFELPYQHFHFLQNTRLFFESKDFFFVHAGVDPELSIEESKMNKNLHYDFLWTREHLHESNNWVKTVVFGHTPVSEPINKQNMIGIDTGCVFKHLPGLGRLTAVLLPEKVFIHQKCIDEPKPY
jgi:serine/threonine protein phosphatase 1